VGTGAATAAKLLKRYGSIAGIEAAAERGELAGWSQAVQRLFSQGPAGQAQRQLLHRNRQLFTIHRSPGVLPEQHRAEVLSRAAQLGHGYAMLAGAGAASGLVAGSSGDSGGESANGGMQHEPLSQPEAAALPQPPGQAGTSNAAELAWAHPLHARRWQHVGQFAQQLTALLQKRGAAAEVRAVTSLGLAVDILVHSGGALLGAGEESEVVVLIAGVADMQSSGRGSSHGIGLDTAGSDVAGPAAEVLSAAADRSSMLVRRLNGSLQHHVRLLKKEGLQVVCVPWWLVPQACEGLPQ
jgi:hypothetical protein